MQQFIAYRLLNFILVLLGVSILLFAVFHVAGGNPVYRMLPPNASPLEIKKAEKELGLDKPLYVQYFKVLTDMVTLKFGKSYSTKQNISDMLISRLGPTLKLTLPAFLLFIIFGITIGMLSACFRGRFIDKFLVFFSVFGMSIPLISFIILGQYLLSFKLGLFPISGYLPGIAGIPYLTLPIIISVIAYTGYDVRLYRSIFLDEIQQDYVTTARAKGVPETRVMFKHVLKNAMIPIVTKLSMELPFIFLGTILLEQFFSIPGLGSLVVTSIDYSDFPVLKAVTILFSLIFMTANLISDLLYTIIDPRIKLR